jgi:hypothetical protein
MHAAVAEISRTRWRKSILGGGESGTSIRRSIILGDVTYWVMHAAVAEISRTRWRKSILGGGEGGIYTRRSIIRGDVTYWVMHAAVAEISRTRWILVLLSLYISTRRDIPNPGRKNFTCYRCEISSGRVV